MSFEEGFIKDTVKRLRYYKDLGDKTFDQLEEKDFFWQPNEASNSIAIIVQHMHGNMMSRFTDFLTEDGEKTWRHRDDEFEPMLTTKQEVLTSWNQGWHCVFTALENLQPEDLTKTIYIRTEPLFVYDALLRQLAHYPHHIGQLMYIGKLIKNRYWHSLSIPKGESNAFNVKMADKSKR
ncbi:DUF1572 domain-containing protein [soil metagenome]